eukprot:2293287-Pyramimonas_sp.AAC.1
MCIRDSALDMATLRSAPPMCTRRLEMRRLGMRADIEVPGRRTLGRLGGGACIPASPGPGIRWSTGARARGCSSGGTRRNSPAQRGQCFYTATHACNGLLTPARHRTRAGAAQALEAGQRGASWTDSWENTKTICPRCALRSGRRLHAAAPRCSDGL